MNEAETRAELIDPALKAAGWGVVEASRVRREVITLGRLQGAGVRAVQTLAQGSQAGSKAQLDTKRAPTKVIAIGVSTGGPQALQYLFSQLPADFPGTIVVVQHMPEGFTEMFARRLDETCAIRIKEAQSGDVLVAGRVLICPGSRHIKVKRLPLGDVAILSDETRVNGHRPSADVLFKSLAEEFGPKGLAVLMTGMGDDGAQGLGLVKAAGGMTIAQNEESCVVYGMPKAGIERGFALRVVGLEMMANTLQVQCMSDRKRGLANGTAENSKAATTGQE